MKANHDNLTNAELNRLAAQAMTFWAWPDGLMEKHYDIPPRAQPNFNPLEITEDLAEVKQEIGRRRRWGWQCLFWPSCDCDFNYDFTILTHQGMFRAEANTEGRACLIAFLKAVSGARKPNRVRETNESST